MAPSWTPDLRRVLRCRNLVVREATRMKNRITGLLMETGTPYNKKRLHGKRYFNELMGLWGACRRRRRRWWNCSS
jgi:transposase